MANGATRLWMGVALGSVLVVGVSAGLLADRFLPDRRAAESERPDARPAHAGRSSSMFHFDCRDEDGAPSGAAAGSAREAPDEAARAAAFEEHRSKMTHRMARRLDLEPEQIEALEPIVGEAMLRGRRYWTGARDEFCAMQDDFHRQVGELLRPDQAARFDEMRRDLWDRGRRHDNRDRDDRRRDDGGGSPESCR